VRTAQVLEGPTFVAESNVREPERMLERCSIASLVEAPLENLDAFFLFALGAQKVRQGEVAPRERRREHD
jgi:hypothetical protein